MFSALGKMQISEVYHTSLHTLVDTSQNKKHAQVSTLPIPKRPLQTPRDHLHDLGDILYVPIPSLLVGYKLNSTSLTPVTLLSAITGTGSVLCVLPRPLASFLGFCLNDLSAMNTDFASCHILWCWWVYNVNCRILVRSCQGPWCSYSH